MKLLYSCIILGLIQLLAIKPLTAFTNSNEKTTIKQRLVEIYEKEMIPLDTSFCEKAKILGEKLLKDKSVKQPKTAIMREFKQNITDFLLEYPLYMRYGLMKELSFEFDNKLPEPSNNKDIQYIRQLIKKLGYNEISKDYNGNSTQLVKQKLLPKFEELIKRFSSQEIKHHKDLINLYHDLSSCSNYECQYKYLHLLEDPSPKLILFDYITKKLYNIYIVYGNKSINIARSLLKEQQMSQLPQPLRNNVTNNIKDFINQYERHRTIKQLKNLTRSFFTNILTKYYHNNAFPLREQKLIVQIFDGQGCTKFVNEISGKLHDFVQHGLFRKFQQFKAVLNRQKLAKEKPLIQWYDRLKRLHHPADILTAFENLKAFN